MKIEIKHNSKTHAVELPDDATLGDLKAKLAELTKVPPAMQKLTGRPNLKDDSKTCQSYGIRNGGKLLLVGNPVEDVVSANKEDGEQEKKREEFVRNLPGNFWALPPYGGMLADPFVEGKGAPVEGGSAALSLTVLDMVLGRINTLGTKLATVAMHADAASTMDHPFLSLSSEDRKRIAVLHSVVRKSQEFANQAQAAVKPEDVVSVVETLVGTLRGLKNKEYFIVPSGYIGLTGHNVFYLVVSKDATEEYTVTVVNTSPAVDAGLDFHPQVPTSEKIKAKTCLTLPCIPSSRILDEAFWLMTLSMWMKANDGTTQSEFCRGEVLYDVLLPWLVEEVSFTSLENRFPSLASYRLEATSTGKASKFGQWVHQLDRVKGTEHEGDFTTPQRSHNGATKALMTACSMLLREFGMSREMAKRVKFVIKFEFFLKGVEELVMLSKRHLALYGGTKSNGGPTLPVHLRPLATAVERARSLGVDPQQSQRTITQLLDKAHEGKGLIRRTDGARTVIVPPKELLGEGRSIIVYFGALWCGPCKKVSPFVVEGYKSLMQRHGGNAQCEFLFVSADRNQEEYDEYSERFPFPKVGYPPTEGLFEASGISSIPTLLVFGADGTLLTADGVAALMQDPEMLQFPGGPWSGAQSITSTDTAMLGFANSVLSHHALKKFQQGLFNETHVQKVNGLTQVVTELVDALPWRNDEGAEELPAVHLRAAPECLPEPAGTLPPAATAALSALPGDVVEFENTGMLNTAPTVQYAGVPYNSAVPELGDLSAFVVPTTMAELMLCMLNAEQHINKLWLRAQHSGTSSRVAVQMQIIEFITWMFTSIIPIPRPNTAEVAAIKARAGTPQEKRQVAAFAHVGVVPDTNSSNLVDNILAVYNSVSSTLYSEPLSSDGVQDEEGSNAHLRLASSIYRMMLSYATAWQSVENPTRSFDSERALTSVAMLAVFDAVVRNPTVASAASTDSFNTDAAATPNSSSSMALLASLLNSSNGGYYVSTTLCTGTVPFKEASSTFELTRPRHLAVRDALVTLISFNEVRYSNELFDLRVPEKIELRKHSPTVQFLRRFIESCGYSLGGQAEEEEEEQASPTGFAAPGSGMENRIQQRIQQMLRGRGGGRGGLQQQIGGNEMEKLMFWMCDSRSPLAQNHTEFTMLRDMVLLTKFMATMEMRDSQLLRKRKELDEFASWRLSFEEDTPGRQMSAGWRTNPKPLFWELLMVRGRDMDIADIVVKGFGDREVSQYGEGLAIHSPIDVAAQLNLQSPMEEDIIHATTLPTFGGVLSQEEAEGLWSMLTVPYLRIPLVLDFFASQDRHTYLFSPAMQQVLRATLFEAGQYAPPIADPASKDANRTEVPLRLNASQRQEADLAVIMSATAEGDTTRLLGTSHGLLLNELLRSPQSVIKPLLRILATVTEGGSSSVYSVNATYALFLCSLACDVRDFIQYALESVLLVSACGDDAGSETTQRNKHYLLSGQAALEETLLKTLFPLLRQWRIEAEENEDIPSQCVVHSHLAMLWKTVSQKARLSALTAGGADADTKRQEQEALWAMLRSCAFVRARHGFGMGIQRTQLAAQEGDAALTSEEKLMRFLQAQGLSTQQVTPELLEHGKRMMMAGGRRRAVFVQIRSRHFSDTVRVPNLIRSDPTSTSESKALKLPPVDVPENTLFAILQDNYPALSAFISGCSEADATEFGALTLNTVVGSIVAAVLKDKAYGDAPHSPTSGEPRAVVHHGRWVRTGPDVYTAPASGLVFHLQTCELFWRDEEIKPVPDSMSHFSDYEAILGKDVVQCGRVSRTAHRHWVHVVGTPYDLIEWDAHDPVDQGVFQPMITVGPPEHEEIQQIRYHNILYSRPIDIYEDDPWPIREERWAVNLVKQIYLEAYPMAGDMKFKVLLPEEVHAAPAPPTRNVGAAEADDNDNQPTSSEVVLRDEIRMLLTDWQQYPEEEDRRTWKEIVVTRLTKVRPVGPSSALAAKRQCPFEGYELVDEDIRMNVFTLVPHARKMYRVLHYTTSLRTSLASLALLTKPRTLNEYFKTTRYQAGELKRRIKHEGTLEIHRYNHVLNGREVFLPPRLLQGVLPSSLLENMLFWHGEDNIIRGYPTTVDITNDETAATAKPDADSFANHWFNYAIEVELGEGASPQIYSLNPTGAAVGGVSSCRIIRLNDGLHRKIRGAPVEAELREGIESENQKAALAQALGTLRGLFPDYKDRVLVYAFSQCRSHVAKTVDWLGGAENAIIIQALQEGTAAGLVPRAAVPSSSAEGPASPQMSQRSGSMERVGSCVELGAVDVAGADDREEVSQAPLHLLRMHSSPEMEGLAALLSRVEDFSHVLAWGRQDGKGVCSLHVVEIPRLRAKFQPKDAGGGKTHLWLVDNPGWRVAAGEEIKGDARIAKLMRPFDQCIVMFNVTSKELALFVPNHDFARMDVAKDPMNRSLLFDRASMQWVESVPSPFYLLPLHPSREFLLPPSLPASLYCAVLLTAKREYASAMRYMEACYVDTPFTSEEQFMFSLMGRTLTSASGRSGDNHPDAHSARLKLAHSAMHSDNKIQWPLHQEVTKYLLKLRHVSVNCALTHEELTDLMKRCTRGSAVIKTQLEYWVGVASGRPTASVRAPPVEKPGQPWEKLLAASSSLVMAAPKLTRLQFKPPASALHDSALVAFLWEDKLMLDEESGTNSSLGFYFLYSLKKRAPAVNIQFLGKDVTATMDVLLTRHFQLRHARWGKEGVAAGEAAHQMTFAMACLACMERFPAAPWPDLTDNLTLRFMTKGLDAATNLRRAVSAGGAFGMPEGDDGFGSTYVSPLRRFFLDLESTVRRQIGENAKYAPFPMPDAPRVQVPCQNHILPRPTPSNTGMASVTLRVASDAHMPQPTAASMGGFLFDELGLFDKFLLRETSAHAEEGGADSGHLPFDLTGHPLAQSHVAKDMLARLDTDAGRYADQVRAAVKYFLNDSQGGSKDGADIARWLASAGSKSEAGVLDQVSRTEGFLRLLTDALTTVRDEDVDAVQALAAEVTGLANGIHNVPSVASSSSSASTPATEPITVTLHKLRLVKGSRNHVSVEWLCGALLSSSFADDLKKVNPFHADVELIRSRLVSFMLRSNRAHLASQAIGQAQQLLGFMSMVRVLHACSISHDEAFEDAVSQLRQFAGRFSVDFEECADVGGTLASIAGGMRQHFEQFRRALVDQLSIERHYATPEKDASGSLVAISLDPRFLVFEFIFSIVLRERQVEMIRWFYSNIADGVSRVQQMIMGQGKTTVVGPILALMLADGATLVTQVMPTALLEQSRNVLRKCFSVVIPKQIYTLQFDRGVDDSDEVIEGLYQKLASARKNRAIIVSPPECIKALLLKYIEQLHSLEATTEDDLYGSLATMHDARRERESLIVRDKATKRSKMADAIVPILQMWREGVLIMDEVDVLLHPLRSELNFPIGLKHPIDFAGPRWHLPIHILDGIYYHTRRRTCSIDDPQPQVPTTTTNAAESSAHAMDFISVPSILKDLDAVLKEGFDICALQREPHLVLLDTGFYHHRIKEVMLRWSLVWLWKTISASQAKECRRRRKQRDAAALLHRQQHEEIKASEGAATMSPTSGEPPQIEDAINELGQEEFVAIACEFLRNSRKLALHTPEEINDFADLLDLGARMKALLLPESIQLLFLAREWLDTLLPHVLAKINRVGFGILQACDFAALQMGGTDPKTASMPISRKVMAIPFVAKDVPSRSSEFAHPDVVIGLTVLAYRYEGLRKSDVKELLLQLKQDYARQTGPRERRPASVLYNHWARLARQASVDESTVVPLAQLQVMDPSQLMGIYKLLRKLPEAIHYYLCQHIFPRTMNFQRIKISACGHELGSNILFSKRIGFSGTPSNLLPLDLGECFYEPGSDGKILSVLADPAVTSTELLPEGWTPLAVLERIAKANPPFHALIDTGALITNLDNEQVARFLIRHLPISFEGVVFLDQRDRQVVLQRSNLQVVPLAQCGIALSRRFTFFDQVHTTGMDVKQTPTATAALTVGKDMVFRDYAQGAYRMRGIGKGQTIRLFLIPEVVSRVREALPKEMLALRHQLTVPAWLLLNAMRVEGLQYMKLCQQELENIWRKRALVGLIEDSQYAVDRPNAFTPFERVRRFASTAQTGPTQAALKERLVASIQTFREAIGYPIPTDVEVPTSFAQRLEEHMSAKPKILLREISVLQLHKDDGASVEGAVDHAQSVERIQLILDRIMGALTAHAGEAEEELGLNTEVVHEQEAEEEQEQEAEQEEQRISAFCRDEEQQISWDVRVLSVGAGDGSDSQRGSPFFPCSEFQVRPEQPRIPLPQWLVLSDNFFRAKWMGLGDRKLKNCTIFAQWLVGGGCVGGVVSLAEGETLRWLLHNNVSLNGSAGAAGGIGLAIRVVGSGAYVDASDRFFRAMSAATNGSGHAEESDVYTASFAPLSSFAADFHRNTVTVEAGASSLEEVDFCDPLAVFFRFFNSDMFYTQRELAVLEHHVLRDVPLTDRIAFFIECLRLRRRHRYEWEDAPVASLFIKEDETEDLRCAAELRKLDDALLKLRKVEDEMLRKQREEKLAAAAKLREEDPELAAVLASTTHHHQPHAEEHVDPNFLTEEEQLEAVMRASMGLHSHSPHAVAESSDAASATPTVFQSIRTAFAVACAKSVQESSSSIPRLAPDVAAKCLLDAIRLAIQRPTPDVTPDDNDKEEGTTPSTIPQGKVALPSTFASIDVKAAMESIETNALLLYEAQSRARASALQYSQQQRHSRHGDVANAPTGGLYLSYATIVGALPLLDAHYEAKVEAAKAAAEAQQGPTVGKKRTREEEPPVWDCPTCTYQNMRTTAQCAMCLTPKPGGANIDDEGAFAAGLPWNCRTCTYLNDAAATQCGVCGADHPNPPKKEAAGPSAMGAGTFMGRPIPDGFWVCSPEHGGCSLFNPNSLYYCKECDKARPSLATLRF